MLPLYWIDAFSRRPFEGNPAAVVPLPAWPEEAFLQRVAFENNLSETAFLVKLAPGRYSLRWFTPTVEIDLCGHATLASAYVLHTELAEDAPVIEFETRSGLLHVRRLEDDRMQLDFPSRPPAPKSPAGNFEAALGIAPREVLMNVNNWLCVYESMEDLRLLKPDFAAIRTIAPGRVIVTAPGDGTCDFASRFFAPGVGVDEDPVTGSAHCALIPFWAGRLGRTQLFARQLSRRGGELWCSLEGDRVRMAGHCSLYLKGRISVALPA